jgi:hypothetical protein
MIISHFRVDKVIFDHHFFYIRPLAHIFGPIKYLAQGWGKIKVLAFCIILYLINFLWHHIFMDFFADLNSSWALVVKSTCFSFTLGTKIILWLIWIWLNLTRLNKNHQWQKGTSVIAKKKYTFYEDIFVLKKWLSLFCQK